MTDPREQPLNDVARNIMVQSNYDPHFANIEDRLQTETKLFLARLDALKVWQQFSGRTEHIGDGVYRQTGGPYTLEDRTPRPHDRREPVPIPMILFCPNCGVQHIDAADRTEWCILSHVCTYCRHQWRPADVPTNGVKEIKTLGNKDSPEIVRGVIDKTARFLPQWQPKIGGQTYTEIGRGDLTTSSPSGVSLFKGTRMVTIRDTSNHVHVFTETEFSDRFERVTASNVYRRPECIFNYCPSMDLCQQDDVCRHPGKTVKP